MRVLDNLMRFKHPSSASCGRQDLLCILLLLVVVSVTSLVRLHLLPVPLERDEGEYAYVGQLMLQGVPPFMEAYNMKMPGIYGVYALSMALFGQSVEGIHAGLLVVNLLAALLLFVLGRCLFSPLVGCVAGASFAAMSLSPSVLGPFAHAEQFVVLPVLLGAVVLHHALVSTKRYRLFLSGTLMGTGFIILQLGAPFIAFGFFYLLYFERTREHSTWKSLGAKVILFIAGACLPLAAVCAAMLMAGVFDTFFFWTYAYAREYVSLISPVEGLLSLHFTASRIARTLWLPWALAMIGLLGLLGKRFDQNARFFTLSFFIFSFLSICPGFYFREHYFVLVLPAIALLSGIGVETVIATISPNIDGRISVPVTVIFVLVVALSSVFQERTALLETPPVRLARLVYGANPFPESVEIARYIRERSSSDDRIAIIGSEPQIYFYSRRRAATGYLYTYALMENQKFARRMQEQMIQQIESASPRYLVFVNVPTSWLPRPQSERLILSWFNHYQEQYYRVVGVIDILSEETTEFQWDGNAEGYVPTSSCWLKVFERL